MLGSKGGLFREGDIFNEFPRKFILAGSLGWHFLGWKQCRILTSFPSPEIAKSNLENPLLTTFNHINEIFSSYHWNFLLSEMCGILLQMPKKKKNHCNILSFNKYLLSSIVLIILVTQRSLLPWALQPGVWERELTEYAYLREECLK